MIEICNLTKNFGAIKAVDNVSFTVNKGEVLGFLGPNGAGKSTTMRMITGFLPPTSGTAVIGGFDITNDPLSARKRIGYLPENAPVYADMSVSAYLDFCAEIRGFSGSQRNQKVSEALEKCFLSEVKYQTINTLSKGFKQRVCFAQSIIHDPEYLIFDEPTDGLDPNQKHEVRLMIHEMSTDKAIILSTHILDEVDAVCTRAIIIANGLIVADDTPEALRAQSRMHGAVSLTLRNAEPAALLSCLQLVEEVKSAEIVDDQQPEVSVRVYPQNIDVPIADKIMSALSEHKFMVKSIFVEQGRLDEVFRAITTN
ncbi:ABC transporter ATP-binding protein [Thermodesulfobacteriota bacterium]